MRGESAETIEIGCCGVRGKAAEEVTGRCVSWQLEVSKGVWIKFCNCEEKGGGGRSIQGTVKLSIC